MTLIVSRNNSIISNIYELRALIVNNNNDLYKRTNYIF